MDFDKAAAGWDAVPMRSERARAAAEAILRSIGGARPRRGLEFGCGTGLLSFFLKDRLDEILLLDSSAGMIEALREKIAAFGATNMRPIHGKLEDSVEAIGKVDLVYSLMALHHVEDAAGTLSRLRAVLNEGGFLCIIDLDREDGSFHKDEADFHGHNGFDRAELEGLLADLGFREVGSEIVFQNPRLVDGVERIYPLFLMRARK